jgi:stage II sporulation protein D
MVRVGIHWDRTRGAIKTDREWVLSAPHEETRRVRAGDIRARSVNGAVVRLDDAAGRLILEGEGPLRLTPAKNAHFSLDGSRYRGELEISSRNDSLFIVNVIPLEDYLRGVLPGEIGRQTQENAAAAQAVAARTYTVKKLGQYGNLPFDLFASVQDQVYEGLDGENALASAAVHSTQGLVLSGDEGLVDAYYSSTCGGMRSDISVVWPHREAMDELRGGPDGEGGHAWCRESPHFEWKEFWSGERLTELVRRHLPQEEGQRDERVEGPLTDIVVRTDEDCGRIREIEYCWKGGSAKVRGDRNRWILRRPDGAILRSVFLDLQVEKQDGIVTRVVAQGRGNGHGVGMCQMGAIARARAGQGFRKILEAYYPGAEIRNLRMSDLSRDRS